jgi:hypothetical protein
MITRRAGHACEICGAGEDRPASRGLEAHKRWAYDEHTSTQTLRRLICLRSDCHLSTHLGFANVTGRAAQAISHLRQVTGMSDARVSSHVNGANTLWTERSRHTWTLDLTKLTAAGVTLRHPEHAKDRPDVARSTESRCGDDRQQEIGLVGGSAVQGDLVVVDVRRSIQRVIV